MFDEAQAECVMLMKAHVRGFVESKYAQLYLKKKGRQGGSEVMYRKKRGGPGLSRALEDARAGGSFVPSQRSSITLGRAKIEEAEEEDDEGSDLKVHVSPVVAFSQPTTHSTPVVAITQKRTSHAKMTAAPAPVPLSSLRADDLQAEIAALEFPGAEAAALFNPTAKKKEAPVRAAAAPVPAEPASARKEVKVAEKGPKTEEDATIEAGAGLSAREQKQTMVGDETATAMEVESSDVRQDSTMKAVDADVEEEVARLLVEDTVRSSSMSQLN